jgi:hypothetical protein
MKKRIVLILLFIASASSCNIFLDCIDGNEIIETDERTATPFTAIANETSFQVVYVKGDEYTITVEAESNIIPYIETDIRAGALEVSTVRGIHCLNYTTQPVITVTAPLISELVSSGSGDMVAGPLEGDDIKLIDSGSGDITTGPVSGGNVSIIISGSGNINTDEVLAESLKATLSGSGDLTMQGEIVSARYIISGSGSIFSRDLSAGAAVINISGSGSVYTTVNDNLDAVLSGSGNIYLQGNPQVSLTRTGSGRIIYL